jgi:hypothetical protein
MTVLEGQNILVTISGKKRRIRVYYLSWLKQKILRTEGVRAGGSTNGSYLLHPLHGFCYALASTIGQAKWVDECGRLAGSQPLQNW